MSTKGKRKAPAFQLYADDFLAGTADMTAEEVGGFIRLLCHQWAKGGVPDSEERSGMMAGLMGSPSLRYVLSKFEKDPADGLLKNKRLESVRSEKDAYLKSQSESGLKGALARWNQCRANGDPNGDPNGAIVADGVATPMANGSRNDGSPSPSPKINTYVALAPEAEALKERISVWFKRRPTTPWSSKEIKALKDVIKLGTPPEDIDLLERRYMSGDQYLRREIITLLNNWNGEIDRARGLSRSPQPQLELPKPKRPPGKEWMDDPNDWRHAL